MANQDGATEVLSTEAAAERILGVVYPQEEEAEVKVTEEAKEPEESAAEETEGESEEASEEATQPEGEVEIDPDEKWIEVEEVVEGGAKEVKKYSLNELKAQRMMQADYQRKTAELARQREEVQTQLRQGVEKEREQFKQALDVQQKLVWSLAAQELQNVDMDKLATEDPAEYIRVQNRLNKFNQAIQGIQAEQYKLAQQEREYLEKEFLPKASEQIQRDIPNWGPELKQSLLKSGVENYGFTSEELQAVVDPRMVKVLHDAYQYQQFKAQKSAADKKVVAKPKVLKPGTKQPKEAGDGDSLKRLKQTGRYQDAAEAILRRL